MNTWANGQTRKNRGEENKELGCEFIFPGIKEVPIKLCGQDTCSELSSVLPMPRVQTLHPCTTQASLPGLSAVFALP